MDVVLTLLASAVLVALFVALWAAPRWCFRSLARYRLWELRDSVVDDILDGKLPADDEAVVKLRRDIDRALKYVTKMSLLDVLLIQQIVGVAHTASERPSLDAMNDRQRNRIERHRERLGLALFASLLLGSWLGVAVGAWSFLKAGLSGEGRGTLREAAEVASKSWLGRRTVEGATKATNCPSLVG